MIRIPHARNVDRWSRAACAVRAVRGLLAGLVIGAWASGCSAAVDPAAIQDAQTAARVKTALINDAEIGTRAIAVRVTRGVVRLSGRVHNDAEADRAVAVARAVPGVVAVHSELLIGADPPPQPPDPRGARGDGWTDDAPELQPNPNLLALGLSVGASLPRADRLHTRRALSPLIKLGSGEGFGLGIGLDWFNAEVESVGGAGETITRVNIRPVMLGISYTVDMGRSSFSPSVVGGYAFNSLTVTDSGATAGLPVEAHNSLAWRLGGSAWFDLGHRLALNISGGYLMTRLRLTVLEGGRLEERKTRGDTALVHAGIAYRLF